jgi:hypothetical protein
VTNQRPSAAAPSKGAPEDQDVEVSSDRLHVFEDFLTNLNLGNLENPPEDDEPDEPDEEDPKRNK